MRLPFWFRQELPAKEIINERFSLFRSLNLHTVCQEAHCPNLGSCFKEGTITFMILGNTCTRNCRFCAVKKNDNNNLALDYYEPQNIARLVRELKLDYVVVTSVTRDDLADGGAGIFASTIREIRSVNPQVGIEVLVPDFKGQRQSIEKVGEEKPDVIAHNLETVPRLFSQVRDKKANYSSALELLIIAKEIAPSIFTKSSLMLGLGERYDEVLEVLEDLRKIDCDMVTLGQYLAPNKDCYQVKEFLSLEQFKEYKEIALSLGFRAVASGPLVRSSYRAKELLSEATTYGSPPKFCGGRHKLYG